MKNELLNLSYKVEELYSEISKGDAVPDVDLQKITSFLSRHFQFNKPQPVSE